MSLSERFSFSFRISNLTINFVIVKGRGELGHSVKMLTKLIDKDECFQWFTVSPLKHDDKVEQDQSLNGLYAWIFFLIRYAPLKLIVMASALNITVLLEDSPRPGERRHRYMIGPHLSVDLLRTHPPHTVKNLDKELLRLLDRAQFFRVSCASL